MAFKFKLKIACMFCRLLLPLNVKFIISFLYALALFIHKPCVKTSHSIIKQTRFLRIFWHFLALIIKLFSSCFVLIFTSSACFISLLLASSFPLQDINIKAKKPMNANFVLIFNTFSHWLKYTRQCPLYRLNEAK